MHNVESTVHSIYIMWGKICILSMTYKFDHLKLWRLNVKKLSWRRQLLVCTTRVGVDNFANLFAKMYSYRLIVKFKLALSEHMSVLKNQRTFWGLANSIRNSDKSSRAVVCSSTDKYSKKQGFDSLVYLLTYTQIK